MRPKRTATGIPTPSPIFARVERLPDSDCGGLVDEAVGEDDRVALDVGRGDVAIVTPFVCVCA
jgi:hypothetical protein